MYVYPEYMTTTPAQTTATTTVTEQTGHAILAATVIVRAANMADAYAKGAAALSLHAEIIGKVPAVERSEITGIQVDAYTINYF